MQVINLQSVRALIALGFGLRAYKKNALEELALIDHILSEAMNWANQRVYFWQNESLKSKLKVDRMRSNLVKQNSQTRIKAVGGNSGQTSLVAQNRALNVAVIQFKSCEEKLQKAMIWRDRLIQAMNDFGKEEIRYKNLLTNHTQSALGRLGILISKYQSIYDYNISKHSTDSLASYSDFDRQKLSANILASEGQHGAMYEMAKKAFMLQSLGDPNTPGYIKGWILQEINGFSKRGYLRNPPGFQVGHRVKGLDDPKKFGWENADVNQFRGGKFKR
jgi:hypothetical protein